MDNVDQRWRDYSGSCPCGIWCKRNMSDIDLRILVAELENESVGRSHEIMDRHLRVIGVLFGASVSANTSTYLCTVYQT